jgi:pimeloyl-ACP methyl ester carboxylesterase
MAIEPKSHKVNVRDIAMHYVDWGGSGPPLLCVHGLSAHCRWWDRLGEALHDRCRVLAVDLRGRGDSDKPETGYGYDAHIQDLDAFMDALGLGEAAYAGHSMGANIGVYFAGNCPKRVSRLILMDGGGAIRPPNVEDSLKKALDALSMTWPSMEAYLDYWRPAVFLKDWNKYIETELRHDVNQNPDGTIGRKASKTAVEYDLSIRSQVDLRACYPRIECPTLVLKAQYGILTETDWVLLPEAARQMAESIPDCKLVEVINTNHYTILLSRNEQLHGEVIRFLSP